MTTTKPRPLPPAAQQALDQAFDVAATHQRARRAERRARRQLTKACRDAIDAGVPKAVLARKLHTSRSQLDRILNDE